MGGASAILASCGPAQAPARLCLGAGPPGSLVFTPKRSKDLAPKSFPPPFGVPCPFGRACAIPHTENANIPTTRAEPITAFRMEPILLEYERHAARFVFM